jgi:hypothetical protein
MPLCHYFHNGCELNIILRVLLFAIPTLYLEFTLSSCILQLWQARMYCERIEICIVNSGESLIVCSQVVAPSHHQKISEHIFTNHARKKKPLPSKGLLLPQLGTTGLRTVFFP